jgi:predicted lysophospholipase L1 biosynthesis ABC-type transport system permease subunit
MTSGNQYNNEQLHHTYKGKVLIVPAVAVIISLAVGLYITFGAAQPPGSLIPLPFSQSQRTLPWRTLIDENN